MKRIIVAIDANGNTQIVDAVGFGHGCQTATENLERRLGKVDESTRADTESLVAPVSSEVNLGLN